MSRVIVLRPEPGASATVDRARDRGLEAIAIPLFEIEPVAWSAPDSGAFDGLLLTSANAVRQGGKELAGLRGLPVYAVGSSTAELARAAGFDIASTGEAGVDRLLGSIEAEVRLLHLCGENRRTPECSRQNITEIVVYRAKPIEAPDLGETADAVTLIHSPRAGRRFAELVSDRETVAIAAISEVAADAVGSGWAAIEVADQPNDEALLALAARLCNKPGAE